MIGKCCFIILGVICLVTHGLSIGDSVAAPRPANDSVSSFGNPCESFLDKNATTSFPFLSNDSNYNNYARCYLYSQCLMANGKLEKDADLQSLAFFGLNDEILHWFQKQSTADSIVHQPIYSKKLDDSLLLNPSHYLSEISNAKVLIINDDHTRRATRAFFLGLLPQLKKMGYHYLAMEALWDTAYAYPSYLTGFYFQEPIMAEIYREAKRLGMALIKYEYDSHRNRDSMQAVNLYEQIKNINSTGKVVVYSGQSHLWEDCSFCSPLFGQVFKKIAHINPVTIDQTRGLSHDYYPDIHFDISSVQKGGIISSRELNLKATYGCSFVDAFYIHPKYQCVYGRPEWLSCGGIRKPYRIQRQFKDSAALIQVYYAKETANPLGFNYITPADMVSRSLPGDSIVFYLVPGYEYVLVYRDGQNHILSKKTFIFE